MNTAHHAVCVPLGALIAIAVAVAAPGAAAQGVAPLSPAASERAASDTAVDVRKPRLLLLPESQVNRIAAQQYLDMTRQAQVKGRLNRDPAQLARVRQIAQRLVVHGPRFHPGAADWQWEVNLVDTPAINAFAMPGGKVMVFAGLIDRLKLTDDELAAVIGHEIAHALLEHGRARMSQELVKELGLGLAAAVFNLGNLGFAAAHKAAELAISLPYSRSQETDADLAGLELAARAGYDPRAAVTVWHKMSRSTGGGQPPQWLSTHPGHARRVKDIEAAVPAVLPLYEEARRGR